MKVAYVLTSEGNDSISTMARISIASVRISNPGAAIIIVVDKDTIECLKNNYDPIIDETDKIIVCDTPKGNNIFKSRYIRTSITDYLSDDFLILDVDTFVKGSLEFIFSMDSDIACAVNHSKDNYKDQLWHVSDNIINEMGWKISDSFYINSGVLYFNATEKARILCKTWHRKWFDGYRATGMHYDQPAFNASIQETNPKLSILPHKYNAQFRVELSVATDGVILHYYASGDNKPLTAFEALVQRILGGDELNMREIKKMAARRHPWRRDSWLDDFIAMRVMKKAKMDDWEKTWLEGRRKDALKQRYQELCSPKNKG
ncbi:MAG TPA: glycosyltransferase [Geobacteraceae bacterium]|nr:glycosyltransferase [Geobacteraceae bacterium]